MSLVPVKYPLDRTGKAAANYVADEPHQLATANYRVLVPRHGAFFTESLRIREAAGGRDLVVGADYYPALLYTQPTMDTGKEIHQIVVITNPNVSTNLLFSAQMLGGEYSYSWDGIVQLVQDLHLDQRGVLFESIIAKPETYPPAPHMHDIGDVYGFEYQVAALERIRQAILMGGGAHTRALFQYLDGQIAEMNARIDAKISETNTAEGIIETLGYRPYNEMGGAVKGPAEFQKGITSIGYFRERIKRVTATTALTVLDLSLASVFEVTLTQSTTLKFNVANIAGMTGDDSLSFTLIVKENATGGHACAFESNVEWADKATPPRTTGPNAKDEFYFSSFNGGVKWTGSLSNKNVGQPTA